MADIVIDYELLNRMGKDTDTLKNKISDARTQNNSYDPEAVGPEASFALDLYYAAWSGAFKHSWDLLQALSTTYTSVAQQWFDQDAAYAATANEQAAGFVHSMWQMKESAYENWVKLSHTYVPSHQFDDNGNPYDVMVPLADPQQPPDLPGAEPAGYSYTGPDGSQQTTDATYDPNGNLTSSDTVITDGSGGMTYHEHTTFGGNGSYTSTVSNTDGSSYVATVTGNPDGSGTMTVVTTNPDGSTSTQSYTGTGVNTDAPQWTQTGGGGSGGGDSGSSGHPQGGAGGTGPGTGGNPKVA